MCNNYWNVCKHTAECRDEPVTASKSCNIIRFHSHRRVHSVIISCDAATLLVLKHWVTNVWPHLYLLHVGLVCWSQLKETPSWLASSAWNIKLTEHLSKHKVNGESNTCMRWCSDYPQLYPRVIFAVHCTRVAVIVYTACVQSRQTQIFFLCVCMLCFILLVKFL